MSDLNNYSFTGRLGKDSELKYLQSGSAVWTASIGVGYGFGDNKGTNWLRVSVFGKRAESLGNLNLAKGTHVAIAGELRLREYEKQDGTKGWSHEVNANDVTLLGGKQEGGERQQRQEAPKRQSPAQQAPADDFHDDGLDIPF